MPKNGQRIVAEPGERTRQNDRQGLAATGKKLPI
jgi:hypothetical protein